MGQGIGKETGLGIVARFKLGQKGYSRAQMEDLLWIIRWKLGCWISLTDSSLTSTLSSTG